METHLQPAAELDDATRAYTKAMADLCKRDPAMFAAMVRAHDRMRQCGVPEEEARRQILEALRAGMGRAIACVTGPGGSAPFWGCYRR